MKLVRQEIRSVQAIGEVIVFADVNIVRNHSDLKLSKEAKIPLNLEAEVILNSAVVQ